MPGECAARVETSADVGGARQQTGSGFDSSWRDLENASQPRPLAVFSRLKNVLPLSLGQISADPHHALPAWFQSAA